MRSSDELQIRTVMLVVDCGERAELNRPRRCIYPPIGLLPDPYRGEQLLTGQCRRIIRDRKQDQGSSHQCDRFRMTRVDGL